MSRRSRPRAATPASDRSESPRRRFIKLYHGLCRTRQGWQVFSDFCALGALALANQVEKDEDRENRYLALIGRYDVLDDRLALREMLGCVVDALTEAVSSAGEGARPAHPASDFLGSLFMELELSSHWHGQFFTPYVLCETMARMTYARDDIQRHVDEDGFVTVLEPACGAGAMAIAFAEVMREYGFLPHEHTHVVAVDVDATAAHMCFIQLALLGIPAAVHVGNTLTGEMREVFYTPAHILGAWSARLWLRRLRSAAAPGDVPDGPAGSDTAAASPPPDISPPPTPDDDAFASALQPARQMDLFAA
jgi:hypothetical protein